MKNKAVHSILDWLNQEINSLNKEIATRAETVNQLQKLADELSNYGSYIEYEEKYNEISQQYEKEKERLVKLHEYYRKMEAECEGLNKKVKGWEQWFYANKDIFDRLFSSGPPLNLYGPKDSAEPKAKDSKKKGKGRKKS